MAVFIGQLMRFMKIYRARYLVIGQKPRYYRGESKIIMSSFPVFVGLPVVTYMHDGIGFGV